MAFWREANDNDISNTIILQYRIKPIIYLENINIVYCGINKLL